MLACLLGLSKDSLHIITYSLNKYVAEINACGLVTGTKFPTPST